MIKKKCSKCKRYKNLDSFHKHKNETHGVACWCKSCVKKKDQATYLKDRYKIIARESKKYICNSVDKNKARKYKRAISLKYRYKITEKDYAKLYNSQEGKCAICKCVSDKNLHLDHNHNNDKIRGLLCINCNLGLGSFKDDIKVLEKALKYLRRHA